MNKAFYQLFSLTSAYSILIAVIIGIVRYKKIYKSYHPFIFFSCAAVVNEAISTYLIEKYKSNTINVNIYVLVELLLLLWLFKNWGKNYRKKIYYQALAIFLTIVWVLDNLVFHNINQFTSIYRILYSYAIVLLSMDHINYTLFTEKKDIMYNSSFLICIGTLFFFSFRALVEIFYLFELPVTNAFYDDLLLILNCLNLVANLLFALAMLWIPIKQQYTLPY